MKRVVDVDADHLADHEEVARLAARERRQRHGLQLLAFERRRRFRDARRLDERDGAGVRPACAISFSPRGSGAEVSFMASRRSQVARLQTNSPVSSMKVSASFRPLRREGDHVRLVGDGVEERIGREVDLALGADAP